MIRRPFAASALAIALLACSLGGTGTSGVQSPATPGTAGGGVPISKATPTKEGQAPAATSEPPTQAPTQPPAQQQTPISGGTETGQLLVSVTDFNIIGPAESPRLIGIVQNVSQVDLYRVRMTIIFYNADGTVADTSFGSTFLVTLPSGEVSVFEFLFPRGVPASIEAVGATVEWEEVYPGYPWSRNGFSVISPQGSMGPYNFEITGQVQNNSGKHARSVNLLAIAYNADDHILGYGFKVLDELSVGSIVPFNMEVPGGTSLAEPEIDHFEVLVEAWLED